MPSGTLQVYTALAENAAPLPGVTVLVLNEAGTQVARLTTNDVGSAPELVLAAPDEAYSLDEANTTVRPYAVYQLRAEMTGFQTIELEGVQVFAGQQTVARLQFLPAARTLPKVEPETIPEHPLFAGDGGSGPAPSGQCADARVLSEVVVPKKITVHLARPAVSAANVTVSFQDYIANVASSEVYPTWPDENSPARQPNCLPTQKFHSIVIFCSPVRASFGPTTTRSTSSTASSRVRCETCANSLTRCIWVWIVALSSFCCSSSDSSFSILASALLTSLRKDLFISKNCAESIRPDTLSR